MVFFGEREIEGRVFWGGMVLRRLLLSGNVYMIEVLASTG